MFPEYRSMMNALAFKSLHKSPVLPPVSLAVGGDDEMSNVPLVIFRDQHLPIPQPVVQRISELSYEKTAANGAGDTLSLDNFVTDDFQLGPVFNT